MTIYKRIKAKNNNTIELYTFAGQLYARLVDEFGFTLDDNTAEAVLKLDTYQEALKFAYKYQA